ncbi:hypothetical protein [Arthrobacter rhombi]|uniref:hypothetical protein n=1 Tax=Arthrobacter rhombi TaxID=71253 RepID=UPI003FD5D91B
MTTHNNDTDNSTSASGSCCGHAPQAEDLSNPRADDVTECPVMVGTTVIKAQAEEAGLYRDYQGQRYWLCCNTCAPLFDADPGRYAAA